MNKNICPPLYAKHREPASSSSSAVAAGTQATHAARTAHTPRLPRHELQGTGRVARSRFTLDNNKGQDSSSSAFTSDKTQKSEIIITEGKKVDVHESRLHDHLSAN